MNIGILVTIANNFGEKGFYHSQEVGLARELQKRGHQVTVYKWVKKHSIISTDVLDVTVRYIHSWSFGAHGWISSKEISPEHNALFCFADNQFFLGHIMEFCKEHNILFIPYSGLVHSVQRNQKSKVMDFLFRKFIIPKYHNIPVLAKNTDAYQDYQKYGFTDIKIVPVGLDITELKQDFERYDRGQLRRDLGFSDQETIISFVGRYTKLKRPDDAVRIFKKVHDKNENTRLLMIGDGELFDKVGALIEELELSHYVTRMKKVPYAEMWKYHYISDYYWNLWDMEIFGMALLEAVYYRSSVAAISAPGPDFILEGTKGHKICKTDDEIAEWTLNHNADPSDLQDDAISVLEKCSWKQCADEIERRTAEWYSDK